MIQMNILNKNSEFEKGELNLNDLSQDPIEQFGQWYEDAKEVVIPFANAMSLATVSAMGFPSIRTVLLKFFDSRGFVFYTNYDSAKAKEIGENPNVSLLFYWSELERQVRINGVATKVDTMESMKYFFSRPKESQIGAWCSNQSQPISGRQVLKSSFDKMKDKLLNKEVPFPSFWGGYRVDPSSIEFWQGGKHRLHDRFRYDLKDGEWTIQRLAP